MNSHDIRSKNEYQEIVKLRFFIDPQGPEMSKAMLLRLPPISFTGQMKTEP